MSTLSEKLNLWNSERGINSKPSPQRPHTHSRNVSISEFTDGKKSSVTRTTTDTHPTSSPLGLDNWTQRSSYVESPSETIFEVVETFQPSETKEFAYGNRWGSVQANPDRPANTKLVETTTRHAGETNGQLTLSSIHIKIVVDARINEQDTATEFIGEIKPDETDGQPTLVSNKRINHLRPGVPVDEDSVTYLEQTQLHRDGQSFIPQFRLPIETGITDSNQQRGKIRVRRYISTAEAQKEILSANINSDTSAITFEGL